MFKKPANLAETGKLMVTIASAAIIPNPLTIAAAGLDAYLLAHKTVFERHCDLINLASETQKAFDTELKNPRYDKADDARTLLPQMLEAALPTSGYFTRHGLDADPILNDLIARLTDTEQTRPEIITAFRALYGPLLANVCTDPRLERALRPALITEDKRQQKRQEAKIDDLGARLQNIEDQSRETLESIALRFYDTKPESQSLPDLKQFLIQKSHDLKVLETELTGLRGRSNRLDNLQGAALAALDIPEAEHLLADAREIQIEVLREPLEINADLMVAQAKAALIRGDATEAFELISAAADSFAALDQELPAQRRLTYEGILNALRNGGLGLGLAAQMNRDAIARLDVKIAPADWARAQNNLAIALKNQGTRTGGPTGADLLGQAVAAYRDALTVYTRADHLVDWAETQNNMAVGELAIANHDATPDKGPHLAAALEHIDTALTVYDPERMPYDHATALRDHITAARADP